jgi:hypothetical protein
MHGKPSYMDTPHHDVSNYKWYTMWFLTVEEICPLKYGIHEVWLRTHK